MPDPDDEACVNDRALWSSARLHALKSTEVSMNPRLLNCLSLALLIAVSGCGGGGDSGGDEVVAGKPSPADPTLTGLMVTPTGTTCTGVTDADTTGGLDFETSHPIRAQAYGCLAVDAANRQPVFAGTKSLRFEVRPGDCSANRGYDDCINDRSRHEINELQRSGTQGKVITYDTHLYLPVQPRLRPKGGSALFLTQIHFVQDDIYGVTAYLEVSQSGQLQVRTHIGFTYDTLNLYTVLENPFERWVQVRYEVKSTSQPDGYIRVYVDGVLKVDETRATLPNASAGHSLKLGIYNSFLTRASEPHTTQVVYFDGLAKQVK